MHYKSIAERFSDNLTTLRMQYSTVMNAIYWVFHTIPNAKLCSFHSIILQADIVKKIQWLGGTFTKSLIKQNTHLIAQETSSQKYHAANHLGMTVLTLAWVNDSYSKAKAAWVHQTLLYFTLCLLLLLYIISVAAKCTSFNLALTYPGCLTPRIKTTHISIFVNLSEIV